MRFFRKLHKWLGLIVGIQLLLWTISGLVFALLDHQEVMAEHSARAPEPTVFSLSTMVTEPSKWLADYDGVEIYEIRLSALLDQWVWRVEAADRIELRRVEDGQPFKLDAAFVERLARSHYSGKGKLEAVAFHTSPTLEARDAGPVWQARFDDTQKTTLYFAANDGQLAATRNSTWRVFDFFWMLHTMDYRGRDDFNNPLVITLATGALWLSLSGVILLTRSFRRRPSTTRNPSHARSTSARSNSMGMQRAAWNLLGNARRDFVVPALIARAYLFRPDEMASASFAASS